MTANHAVKRLAGVVAIVVVVAVGAGGSDAAVKAWRLEAMSNRGGSYGSEVFAVSSSGATNIWAVGRSDAPGGQGIIWRAQPASGRWRVVAGPDQASGEDFVDVATWGDRSWVSGTSGRVYEWNGARWVTLPAPPAYFHGGAILANGLTSVWLAGDVQNAGDSGSQPAAAHWNGSRWRVEWAHLYRNDHLNTFQAIAAIPGTQEFIAAGISNAQACEGGRPIAEIWTGTTWDRMPITAPTHSDTVYECNNEPGPAVNNQWLTFPVTSSTGTKPFIWIRAGHGWIGYEKFLPVPHSSTYWDISGIDGPSTANVWAVGSYYLGPQGTGQTKPLVEHWNGKSWSIHSAPTDGADSFLHGVSYVPGTCQVDAVAGYKTSPTGNPLPFDERYC